MDRDHQSGGVEEGNSSSTPVYTTLKNHFTTSDELDQDDEPVLLDSGVIQPSYEETREYQIGEFFFL